MSQTAHYVNTRLQTSVIFNIDCKWFNIAMHYMKLYCKILLNVLVLEVK